MFSFSTQVAGKILWKDTVMWILCVVKIKFNLNMENARKNCSGLKETSSKTYGNEKASENSSMGKL